MKRFDSITSIYDIESPCKISALNLSQSGDVPAPEKHLYLAPDSVREDTVDGQECQSQVKGYPKRQHKSYMLQYHNSHHHEGIVHGELITVDLSFLDDRTYIPYL